MDSLSTFTEGDELEFITYFYGDLIDRIFGENEIGVSFFADSEKFVDEIRPVKKSYLEYNSKKITVYQDFSIKKGAEILTDCNVCKIDDKRFIKIITPFTRERSYDFIVGKKSEMPDILMALKKKREKINFTAFSLPIIGIDLSELRKETIDFLLDKKFRKFCVEKGIPLKRGIILEGRPGTGKTLSLKWLKEKALKYSIKFHRFKDPDDFLRGREDFYGDRKKIFVFEDFDSFLMERSKQEKDHNVILATILNTLEGIDEIKNVATIFTTNQLNYFDQAFLRPGRIDRIITYDLPKKEQWISFFKAYISELEDMFNDMRDFLETKSCDISYAVLKGICDDINIFLYDAEESITLEKIKIIIDKKLSSSLGQRTMKNSSEMMM